MPETSGDPRHEPYDLTPADVARIMGVSASTVSRWADEGHLRSFRTPGRQRRFRRSDVDALLSAGLPAAGAAGVA